MGFNAIQPIRPQTGKGSFYRLADHGVDDAFSEPLKARSGRIVPPSSPRTLSAVTACSPTSACTGSAERPTPQRISTTRRITPWAPGRLGAEAARHHPYRRGRRARHRRRRPPLRRAGPPMSPIGPSWSVAATSWPWNSPRCSSPTSVPSSAHSPPDTDGPSARPPRPCSRSAGHGLQPVPGPRSSSAALHHRGPGERTSRPGSEARRPGTVLSAYVGGRSPGTTLDLLAGSP